MSEIEKASKLLHMTPQTLRLFIREGKFGVAIKRKRWVYKVNWKEVNEYLQRNHQLDRGM